MWIAVLFVGLFGGDIVSSNGAAGAGTSTTVPAAVVLAVLALIGTISVARRGFTTAPDIEELREELQAERQAREALAADVVALERRQAPPLPEVPPRD